MLQSGTIMKMLNKLRAYIYQQFGNYLIGFSILWLFLSSIVICFRMDSVPLLFGLDIYVYGPMIAKVLALIGIVTLIWGITHRILLFESVREIEYEEAREQYRIALMGLQENEKEMQIGNNID